MKIGAENSAFSTCMCLLTLELKDVLVFPTLFALKSS